MTDSDCKIGWIRDLPVPDVENADDGRVVGIRSFGAIDAARMAATAPVRQAMEVRAVAARP